MVPRKYEHKYKDGKKEEVIPLPEMIDKVKNADLAPEQAAYFMLLYWCGCRKSEGYERVSEDFEITDTYLIVDFHKRKKGSAEVKPLKIPRHYPGVDKIVSWINRVRTSWKLKKVSVKTLYIYVDHKRTPIRKKGVWVFPHIQSTTAWEIARKVLGDGYYPHFLRLNRLTEVGSDPETNITRMKSFSGIKSLKSIQAYLGIEEKEQDAAFESFGRKYNLNKS